jgi:hypothetical protein
MSIVLSVVMATDSRLVYAHLLHDPIKSDAVKRDVTLVNRKARILGHHGLHAVFHDQILESGCDNPLYAISPAYG